VSTTNPKWTTLELKQDFRGKNMVTNCLSYDLVPWRSNRLILQFFISRRFARNRTTTILNPKWQKGIQIKFYVVLTFGVGGRNFPNCISREVVTNSTTAGWNKIGVLAATRSWYSYLLQNSRRFIRIIGHSSKLAESRLTGENSDVTFIKCASTD
jgi:hypothetical protein